MGFIKMEFSAEMCSFRVELDLNSLFTLLVGDLFSADLNPRWRRPPAPTLDPSADTLVFQQIDLDYYLGVYFIYIIYWFNWLITCHRL